MQGIFLPLDLLFLHPHPAVANGRVRPARHICRSDLPPLGAEAAHALHDEAILLRRPHAPAVPTAVFGLAALYHQFLRPRRQQQLHLKGIAHAQTVWHSRLKRLPTMLDKEAVPLTSALRADDIYTEHPHHG
eukprot:scaffold42103_cov61-Phaeocystis_antarctica.AAC.5